MGKKPKKKKAKKVKRGSLRRVWSGTVATSKGGLTKDKLTKNKSGKVVSKKRHAQGLKAYKGISKWTAAFMKARKKGTAFLQVRSQALREVGRQSLPRIDRCTTT